MSGTAEPTRSLGAISTTRLEAFSDGVFAIATTLLVLEIKVPHVETGGNLLQALLQLWPSYLAFLVSFLTIGVMWVNHHFLIGLYHRVDRPLLYINLGLLAVISFIPFPTAVVAAYLVDGTQSQLSAATMLYGIVMLLLASMFSALWFHTGRAADSVRDPAAAAPIVRRALRFCLLAFGIYLFAIVSSLFVPALALGMFTVVVLLFVFG